jgi:Holliday junction resolvase RusA-like endonuclease
VDGRWRKIGSMTDSVSFTIPGAARGKGRPRATTINGHARMYADARTVNYENLVRLAAYEAMAGRKPFSGPVSMDTAVYIAPPQSASKKVRAAMLAGEIRPAKRPDLDNYIKAVGDAANGIVFVDDALIVDIFARKLFSDNPRIDVKIQALEPQT